MAGNGHRSADLDVASRELLARLQSHIPFVARPYASIGKELGQPEEWVVERIRSLSEARLIRQISGIFDGQSLGYRSSLVAAQCDPTQLERAARVVSSHPGVSHNYQRDHDFNLWYTIAIPPGESLESQVDMLHRLSGASTTLLLPSVRLFKLGVRLDMEGAPGNLQLDTAPTARQPTGMSASTALGEHVIRAVRALQDPLPVISTPFERAAQAHGFASTEEFLETARELHRQGILRRFSAVLRHREVGYRANGMVVWRASDEECERAGELMARFARVSHCYQRTTHPEWPYSLFTMIHGKTPEEVQDCIDAIRAVTGLSDYLTLYSSREFKKARVRYFTDDWDRWRTEVARWERPAAGNGRAGAALRRDHVRAEDGDAAGTSEATAAQRRMDRMRIWGHVQSLQTCLWEIASLDRRDLDAVREAAKLHAGTGMMLTSCQRLETYSLQGCNCGAASRLFGFDALLHLAEVASGLHSVVLGEDQIAGQVRAALADGPAGVRELGEIALAAARELRREASFDSHAGHLLDRGLSAAQIEPAGRFAVIGTGHMGRLIARRARDLGFAEVVVIGRHAPESGWLEEIAATFAHLDTLADLGPVDVLVGCLGSDAEELDATRDLPLVRKLVLDLGTPRNFAGTSSTPVLAIQDLLGHVAGTAHRDERRMVLRERLRQKLERRLEMAAADSGSTVGALRLEVERMRQMEMERVERLHPELPRDLMDTITRALVNRLFHGVSAGLKEIDDPDFHEQLLALFQAMPAGARESAAASAR